MLLWPGVWGWYGQHLLKTQFIPFLITFSLSGRQPLPKLSGHAVADQLDALRPSKPGVRTFKLPPSDITCIVHYVDCLILCCFVYVQAANPRQNYLAVLRLADLGQGRHGKKLDNDKEGDESSEDESSEEEDESSDESMDEADESGEGKQREGRLTARREGKEPPARMHHR